METTPKTLWSLALVTLLIGLFLWTGRPVLLYAALGLGIGAIVFPRVAHSVLGPIESLIRWILQAFAMFFSGLIYCFILVPLALLHRLSRSNGSNEERDSFFKGTEKRNVAERFRKLY